MAYCQSDFDVVRSVINGSITPKALTKLSTKQELSILRTEIMFKLLRKKSKQIHSLFTIFLLLFQNVAPLFFLSTPTFAQTTITNVALEFNTEAHQLVITGSASEQTDYLITYDDSDDQTPPEAITGQTDSATFEETVFVGTCSGEDCIENNISSGTLEFPEVGYQADFTITDDVLWLTHDNVATTASVELNKTYTAPQNDQVTVTFTTLPEEVGTLSIEEITLTDEQVEALGAVSPIAYDITSSMDNGSFEYDLTLPVPENSGEETNVVYAESVDTLHNVREVTEKEIEGTKVTASGLDHFTIFIITYDQATYSSPWIDYATQGYLNNGVHYPTTITPGETATWDFSTATPGTYKVYISWSTHPNRTIAAPYSLTHVGGTENKTVNQELLADQTTTGSSAQWSNWHYYGEFDIDAASQLVLTGVDNSSGNEYVIADEVLLANVNESPNEIWVDDDYALNLANDGHVWQYDAFDSIQDAVDAAANGATIHVMDGDYQEQIIINKDLELLGNDNPHILSVDNPSSFKVPESTSTFEPVVLIYGGSESGGIISGSEQITVTIDGFDIDGNDRPASSGKRSAALFSRNMIGSISNNTMRDMHVGNRETFGILVYGSSDVQVDTNDVSGYARGGIAISGDNAGAIDPTALVKNNAVSGPGIDEDVTWAPNGIQVGYGATGTVENNTVMGNGWPGTAWSGTAILVVDTLNVTVKNNLVQSNEQAIGVVDFPESVYGSAWSGIVSNISILNNTITSNSWGLSIANEVDNVTVTGNSFSETENDSIDVYTYADTVTPPTNIVIQGNSIESSGLDGLWIGNTVTDQVEAEKNWWGDASGPSGDASGLGETLVGNASYCPWLTNSDLNNPTYGGECLSNIQGRTFIDQGDNGLLLSADGDYPDGMMDNFTVRLYDESWNLLNTQTTRTTSNIGQYNFEGLIDENDMYRVCGVQKDGYSESMPTIGQAPVDTNGNSIPSQYSEAIVVTNGSAASDEFTTCWETTLNNNSGAFLGIGYSEDTNAPEMTDIKMFVNGTESTLTKPGDEVKIQATVTDFSGVDKVQIWVREFPWSPNMNQLTSGQMTNVSGDLWEFVFTVPETYQDSDPLNQEIDGNYFNFRPYDFVGNSQIGWRENFTIDESKPSTPTWGTIYKGHGVNPSNEISCGGYTNTTQVTFEWDENSETDIDGYWFGTKFNEKHQWIDAGTNIKTANMTAGNNPYFYTVIAVDNAGNESDVSEQCGLTLDQEAPDVEITEPSAGIVNGTVSIRGTVTDDNPHHYWFVIQDSGNNTVAGPGTVNETNSFTDVELLNWDTTTVEDGTYTIKLEARDSANNKDNGSKQWVTVTVDNTDPSSTITSYNLADEGEVETSTFSGLIEGTATDATSGVNHVLLSISYLTFGADESETQYWDATGSAWVSSESLFRADGTDNWFYQLPEEAVTDGIYDVTSHAVDNAGNVEDTYTIRIVYDKTIPEVDLTIDPTSPDGDRGWYRFTNPTITLTADDNYDVDYIEYQWNSTSGSWATYTTPFQLPREGQNVLYYRSVDTIGNTSGLGVKEVKYDTTNPAGSPVNVKVENITSNTADASWEAPNPDTDVSFYRLSWKHENGTVRGAETGKDDFNHQLDQLFDGEWTLYIKAMDDAGNFTESSTKFRVGPGPSSGGTTSDGTVLGVTTEGFGTGGTFPAVAGTTTENSETTEEETNEGSVTEESATTKDGAVLGDTTACSGWIYYLPLIMLLTQLILILGFEFAQKEASIVKIIVAIVLTIASIALFNWLKNPECYTESSGLSMVNQWFLGLSVLTGLAGRLIGHTFIEE